MELEKMEKRDLQPDMGYIGDDGKLHDDGLHDEMLASEAGEKAGSAAAVELAIKDGLSRAAIRIGKSGTQQKTFIAGISGQNRGERSRGNR
jgi:hypothetical protein